MKAIDKAGDSAHNVVDRVTDATNYAADSLCKKGGQLKNSEQRLMKDCCSYVQENPITSIGIAAVSGFLLSRIMSGR
jgi:ElaB/YqjD/DUF883 family membrane-anchored ribosome-binding protein